MRITINCCSPRPMILPPWCDRSVHVTDTHGSKRFEDVDSFALRKTLEMSVTNYIESDRHISSNCMQADMCLLSGVLTKTWSPKPPPIMIWQALRTQHHHGRTTATLNVLCTGFGHTCSFADNACTPHPSESDINTTALAMWNGSWMCGCQPTT